MAVEKDSNILAIALAAIAEFGPNAAEVMDRRAKDHELAGELETAELWRRVAASVREIFRGRID
jgi:hypothetical protein